MLQNFFPGIHFQKVLIVGGLEVQRAPEERKKAPPIISTTVEKLWKSMAAEGTLRPQSVSGLTP
jgi:hypothetical protein